MDTILSYVKSWFFSSPSTYEFEHGADIVVRTNNTFDILIDWLKHYIFQYLETDEYLRHYLQSQNKTINYNYTFKPLPSRVHREPKAIAHPDHPREINMVEKNYYFENHPDEEDNTSSSEEEEECDTDDENHIANDKDEESDGEEFSEGTDSSSLISSSGFDPTLSLYSFYAKSS
jgi:hypothetical protein